MTRRLLDRSIFNFLDLKSAPMFELWSKWFTGITAAPFGDYSMEVRDKFLGLATFAMSTFYVVLGKRYDHLGQWLRGLSSVDQTYQVNVVDVAIPFGSKRGNEVELGQDDWIGFTIRRAGRILHREDEKARRLAELAEELRSAEARKRNALAYKRHVRNISANIISSDQRKALLRRAWRGVAQVEEEIERIQRVMNDLSG
jgi:hypothetical protein